jgi:hypothetical protein
MGIQFDGQSKTIILLNGTVSLSVRDLWSRWIDWLLTSDNSKFLQAMTVLGGDEIDPVAGTRVPVYATLQNGWRIRPQSANHTLSVTDGILLVSGGGDPFVNPIGNFVVRILYQQPVTAIAFNVGGGSGSGIEGALQSYGVAKSIDLAPIKQNTDLIPAIL